MYSGVMPILYVSISSGDRSHVLSAEILILIAEFSSPLSIRFTVFMLFQYTTARAFFQDFAPA